MDVDFLDVMQDPVSTTLMEQLGYVKSEAIYSKHIVSEVYSPPRITQELKSRRRRFENLAPGLALDLIIRDPDDGQHWDFSLKSKKRQGPSLAAREQANPAHWISDVHGLFNLATPQLGKDGTT